MDTNDRPLEDNGPRADRRTFVAAVGIVVATLTSAGAGLAEVARPKPVSKLHSIAKGVHDAAQSHGERYRSYPTPQYVPDTYKLVGTKVAMKTGFRTGEDELAFLFLSPYGHPYLPVRVHVTPTTDKDLLGTKDHVGESLHLARTGRNAFYHDGGWAADETTVEITESGTRRMGRRWSTTAQHAIVLDIAGFTIGVVSLIPSRGGVSADELVRIADSVS